MELQKPISEEKTFAFESINLKKRRYHLFEWNSNFFIVIRNACCQPVPTTLQECSFQDDKSFWFHIDTCIFRFDFLLSKTLTCLSHPSMRRGCLRSAASSILQEYVWMDTQFVNLKYSIQHLTLKHCKCDISGMYFQLGIVVY